MNYIKNALILALFLIFVKSVSAQSILKIPSSITEKDIDRFSVKLDENVEHLHLYKNMPSKFASFAFKYIYTDPVQGVYEKLMLETNQPEKWQRFKSRFSVPDSLKIYPKALLNNQLAVFYALDDHQNAVVIVDKNGNKDLSDDEVFIIGKNEIFTKTIDLDIPIEIYNPKLNNVKDSVLNLRMFIETNSTELESTKNWTVSFYNRKNFTAEIKTESFRYVFSWDPLLTPNRPFLSSGVPIILKSYNEENSLINSMLYLVGDTIIVDSYKMIIRQYNGEHLILERLGKENVGYAIGQNLKPTFGVDLFNPQKKIELVSNRYLVIDFWGSWCAPCIAAMPELVEFEKKHKGKVDLISVAYDDQSKVELAKKIVNDHKLTWPQIWDDKSNLGISKLMKIQSFPSLVVVDKNRKIVFTTSRIKDLEQFLEKAK